ncbi:protein-glutamate O-methyltransferase CheR [Treponema sp. C6A8]|uniref:CheR family methyltransferase n=1 Tax=Treponema sp. C6A8 TaxID=1410609 RepID=UPI000486119F|nr:protein-glutamate O-methyltransferase CheR [Treponema sp. C6A8]
MLEVLNDADYELFRKVIYDESGITFSATNRSILDSRIKELLRKKNMSTPQEYYALITKSTEEMKEMLDAVTTNLTRFFRNQPHFDAFINYVIPNIIEAKKAKNSFDKTIKIWSAGCSTGEEPYTLAMIMKEITPMGWDFQITASDISLKCLMTAQTGFYADNKVDGIPENYLQKYFTKVEGGYQVSKDLQAKIKFDYHNLKNDSGARNLDVVFCRNVLIYFDEPAQLKVIDNFWNSMAAHSYLYIGHSESLFGMNTKFEFLKTQWACLYRKLLDK